LPSSSANTGALMETAITVASPIANAFFILHSSILSICFLIPATEQKRHNFLCYASLQVSLL
jgi:hypothetical protein